MNEYNWWNEKVMIGQAILYTELTLWSLSLKERDGMCSLLFVREGLGMSSDKGTT